MGLLRTGIQFLDTADVTEMGPIGYVMLYNGSGADIAAKQAVSIDETVTTYGIGNAIKLAATAEPGMICGGSMEVIPNGTVGRVQVSGVMTGMNATCNAKELLVGSGANAGRLVVQPGAHSAGELVVARALTTHAANLATVQWMTASQFLA